MEILEQSVKYASKGPKTINHWSNRTFRPNRRLTNEIQNWPQTQCYRFPNFPHIHTNASSSQGNELLRIRNGKRVCVMGRGGVVTLQEKKKRTNSDPEDRPCPNCTSESPGGVRFNDVKRWGKGGGRKKRK
ncbi:hypothetical protein CEXT_530571 [Caerostris extrusa]|uniref:Uncharacterized protein n=1 Tax=Caerostris extrusa TaxID=172846 RepID=A0AAV4WSY7_CAEEX|nr:hypothetical protein CEXT_530571 [Caerostris extrusa]